MNNHKNDDTNAPQPSGAAGRPLPRELRPAVPIVGHPTVIHQSFPFLKTHMAKLWWLIF